VASAFSLQRSKMERFDDSGRYCCGEASYQYCNFLCTALRAYIRLLASSKLRQPGLDLAVPTVAQLRLCSLPRCIKADDVERVIASCSPTTDLGIRDRAVLLLFARLGLCSADVVILCLRNRDLRAATLKGKVKDAARFYSRYLRTRAMQC
jgi:site-specific recombinase XerC